MNEMLLWVSEIVKVLCQELSVFVMLVLLAVELFMLCLVWFLCKSEKFSRIQARIGTTFLIFLFFSLNVFLAFYGLDQAFKGFGGSDGLAVIFMFVIRFGIFTLPISFVIAMIVEAIFHVCFKKVID